MTDKCNCNNCEFCQTSVGSSSSSLDLNNSGGTGNAPQQTSGSELLKQDFYAKANANPQDSGVSGTVIMDVLASIQSIIPDVVGNISDVVGYMCHIYFPFGTSSLYGKHDNKTRYTSTPQIKKCFIGANLFTQTDIGTFDGSEFSPYLPEEPYLMTFNFKIPENSKVRIFYGNSSRWMKVRHHQATDGANAYLVIFNYLSPCNSSGELINDDPLPDETSDLVVDPVNAEGTVKSGQNLI